MPCDTVDVLIVGAGPAGCAAALATRGIVGEVMLCAPGPKPQGAVLARIETVGPAVLSAAARLGIRECLVSARIGSVERFIRNGRPADLVEANYDQAAEHWHIDRNRLDEALQSAAAAAGTVIEPTKLTSVTLRGETIDCWFADGRKVCARLLIDAAGSTPCPVPRRRELLSPPLLVSTGVISGGGAGEEGAATRFSSRAWGWLWSTGQCGSDLGWTALADAKRKRPTEIASFISRSRLGSVVHKSATWHVNLQKHPLVLPVGDAAGALDPASGLGIANALVTAISAARVAQGLSRSAEALAVEAATYHDRRIALLLRQADELAQRYADMRLLHADAR